MPYDSNLDEQLFSKIWEVEDTRLTVSLYSYNKGAKKLQVTRENKDSNGNFRFTKLGRILKQELEGIIPFMQEALAEM